MSLLFTSKKIGPVEIKNRFVHAPTYEAMATETGEVTDQLISRYRAVAMGGTALIIPGAMRVHPPVKGLKLAIGIDKDTMIPGLKKLVKTVHKHDSKIFFEIGYNPTKLKKMAINEIEEAISAFGEAARRAAESGADGIHVGCSANCLIGQFLSTYFNKRTDEWGGSDENRYRFMREVIRTCKKNVSNQMAITVKMHVHDYTPTEGMTVDLAKKFAGWLVEEGINGLELSSGTKPYSTMSVFRGEVPRSDFLSMMPFWMKPIGWFVIRSWVGKYNFEEAWNLNDAKIMKAAIGETPFFLVGGLRTLSTMENIVEQGDADFVCLSRPLIREPNLVNKFQTGQANASSCTSCNKCVGAVLNNHPLRCYRQAD
jgi:2,4-dienoyl-CoA reductase-like NADH-dependent reductase (Old Yellow Enzyme family)